MSGRCEAAVGHLAFPLVIGAAIAWTIQLIEAGWSPVAAFVLAQVPAYGIVIALASNFVLIALGAGPPVLMLWLLFSAIHGIFQHCNIPVRIGPLNWIFSMAELHRWHHSRQSDESNTNYGQNLAIWDVVFGTRFLPADREPPSDIGLADLPHFPMTYLAQLASPFRWSFIKRSAV